MCVRACACVRFQTNSITRHCVHTHVRMRIYIQNASERARNHLETACLGGVRLCGGHGHKNTHICTQLPSGEVRGLIEEGLKHIRSRTSGGRRRNDAQAHILQFTSVILHYPQNETISSMLNGSDLCMFDRSVTTFMNFQPTDRRTDRIHRRTSADDTTQPARTKSIYFRLYIRRNAAN